MPTREQLLDAAERVLRAEGLGRATTKLIAQEAGCSEGSIYNHFGDKEELVVCVVAERLPELPGYAAGLPDRAGRGDLRTHLVELARLALAFYRELLPLIGPTIADPGVLARHRERARTGERGPQLPLVQLASYLEREQRLGRVAADADVRGLAWLLLGACFQRAVLAQHLGADLLPIGDDEFAEVTVAALLSGAGPEEDHR